MCHDFELRPRCTTRRGAETENADRAIPHRLTRTFCRGLSDCGDRVVAWSCAVLLICVPILNGCSLVLPHPSEVPPDRGIEQCSLDTLQYRRQVPMKVAAQGVAVPMIVRHVTPGPDRLLRNGQSIYFNDTHPHTDAAPNQDLGDRVLISLSPLISPKESSIWILEAVEKESGTTAADSLVSNRALIRLRASNGGYFRIVDGHPQISADVAEASRLVVYKIDVPDSTRPTSCDEQLRDGDFVFLEALEPGLWLDSSADGTLRGASGSNSSAAECVQERQRCYTDDHGATTCAWAPKCSF
jgi:hypothetical protein